jgi:hypothetical protein
MFGECPSSTSKTNPNVLSTRAALKTSNSQAMEFAAVQGGDKSPMRDCYVCRSNRTPYTSSPYYQPKSRARQEYINLPPLAYPSSPHHTPVSTQGGRPMVPCGLPFFSPKFQHVRCMNWTHKPFTDIDMVCVSLPPK